MKLWYYHIMKSQKLAPIDCQNRLYFCCQMLRRKRRDENLLHNIIFTDESAINLNGNISAHTHGSYNILKNSGDAESGRPAGFLTEIGPNRTNVHFWSAVSGDGTLFGPYFFEATINSETYTTMLRNEAIPALRALPNFNQLVWVQDGAPAHRSELSARYLKGIFGRYRVISKSNHPAVQFSSEWPAYSPDLTPCDYWLFSYIKRLVFYGERPSNIEELIEKLIYVHVHVNEENKDMIRRAFGDFPKRLQRCIDHHGSHFEREP